MLDPFGVLAAGLRVATRGLPRELLALRPRLPTFRRLEDAIAAKRILLTGASSGVGRATAIRLGHAGGEVMLVARNRDALRDTALRIRSAGGRPHYYPADLSNPDDTAALIAKVNDRHGGVDILINNAAHSIRRSLRLSYRRPHDFERTMNLNYFGPVRLILGFLPGMRERGEGHIVNVSTMGVQIGAAPRFSAYIASKAALDAFADSASPETLHDGVLWTTVYMPLVRTPMIAPTTIYRHMPALSPSQAGDMLVHALVRRPRRVSTALGDLGALMHAVAPGAVDRIMNLGYQLFPESEAAIPADGAEPAETSLSRQAAAFGRLLRGMYL